MIAGRYALEREIGRGGMGAVWLARDEVLGRPVAVKRLGLATGGAADGEVDLARAEREARLAAMLNHPHVVAVFDLVVDDEVQWLVMEYVDSLTLAAFVERHGPQDPDRAAALLAQAADALAVAHEAGIVHRDVKPSNLLVTADRQAKLTDFGIARAQADASLTATGLVTGSPAYIAPEVASGRVATPASDVWSLGATLFHALAGRPPYEVGDNVVGALYRIVHEEPPRLGPEAGWLAPVLEATMATDPERRWTMAQVREALTGGPAALPAPVATPRPPAAGAPPAAPAAARHRHDPSDDGAAGSRDEREDRTSLPAVALVAAAVVLVLALVAAAGLLGGSDETPPTATPPATSTPDGQGTPSGDASAGDAPTPSGSDETPDSDDPSGPESPSDRPTAESMAAFVRTYLDTVTEQPARTFEQLTPAFKQQSGGLGGYTDFWSTIRSAQVRNIDADPEALTVSYDVEYRLTSGGRASDSVRLRLEYVDGDYLIAAEA